MAGDPKKIVPGCYYPGCNNAHDWRDKFCPEHHGRYAAHAVDGVVVERKVK